MYPYDRAWRWWASNRFKHLVDGIDAVHDLDLKGNRLLRNRIHQMRRWLVARAVLTPFLFTSVISAAIGLILGVLGVQEETAHALQLFRTLSNTFAGVFAALWFFANRTMGQIEADLLLALTVGTTGNGKES